MRDFVSIYAGKVIMHYTKTEKKIVLNPNNIIIFGEIFNRQFC